MQPTICNNEIQNRKCKKHCEYHFYSTLIKTQTCTKKGGKMQQNGSHYELRITHNSDMCNIRAQVFRFMQSIHTKYIHNDLERNGLYSTYTSRHVSWKGKLFTTVILFTLHSMAIRQYCFLFYQQTLYDEGATVLFQTLNIIRSDSPLNY